MKKHWKWLLVAVVLLAIAAAVARTVLTQRAERQAAAAAPTTQAVLDLSAADVLRVQTQALAQGLPISGALSAANTALVKARVAGELQALSLREGDAVKKGEIVARVDSSEYAARVTQAAQQASAAKAQIDIAQRQFDNNKALVDQGFISKTALDTSLANLSGARATHQAALAALEVAKKSVQDTVLRAPISGQVSQRLAQNGERVGVDARVLEIVDLSRLELQASLSASDAGQVRVGQSATLQVEGAPAPVRATVVRINPSAQAGSRAVLIYLAVDSTSEGSSALRHGAFAQGTLATGTVQTLALPLSAVRTDKPTPYVQVVVEGKVQHQAVKLGQRGDVAGESWIAIENIAANALVLSGSAGLVRPGTAVKLAGGGNGAP